MKKYNQSLDFNNDIKIIIISQVAGVIVHELAVKCAQEIGKTLFITGSEFRKIENKNLKVINAPVYINTSYFTRLFTWLKYFFFTSLHLYKISSKPVLIISSNPPFLSILGYIFKKVNDWPYITRVLDVYPDALIQNKIIKKSNPIFFIWSRMNKIMYDNADLVITLGQVMAKNISPYISNTNSLSVIPDWVDTDRFKPIPKSENWYFKNHINKDKINIIYSGNLGLTHSAQLIIEGIKLLENYENVAFTIVGGGASKEKIKSYSSKLKNLKYLKFQSQKNLPFLLSAADIAIVCLGKGAEGISMPSKLYYSMASGNAILSISSGTNDLKNIVKEAKCGLSIGNNDLNEFSKAIKKFSSDNTFLNQCKKKSRIFSKEKFSSRIVIPKYIDLLQKYK